MQLYAFFVSDCILLYHFCVPHTCSAFWLYGGRRISSVSVCILVGVGRILWAQAGSGNLLQLKLKRVADLNDKSLQSCRKSINTLRSYPPMLFNAWKLLCLPLSMCHNFHLPIPFDQILLVFHMRHFSLNTIIIVSAKTSDGTLSDRSQTIW